MSEVKVFRVTGEIRKPNFRTDFRKEVRALKPEEAVDNERLGDAGQDVADASQQFGNGSDHHAGSQCRPLSELRDSLEETRSISDWWATEPDVGRMADGVPHRVERLRCLGNALVPQVAEWIGRSILEYEAFE